MYKFWRVFGSILLCIIFAFTCYFSLVDKVVKADSLYMYSSSSNFSNFYTTSYSKLTNDSDNIYNVNSNVVTTYEFSSNISDVQGNYLFLGRIGLNFASLNSQQFDSLPSDISFDDSNIYAIFRFRGFAKSSDGSYSQSWFGNSYRLIKSFGFNNGAGYFVYLDLDKTYNSINNSESYMFNINRSSNYFSFDVNSLFSSSGLYVDQLTIVRTWTTLEFYNRLFNYLSYTLPSTLNYITFTDLEFNFNLNFNWDFINSYFGSINYLNFRSYIYTDGSYYSYSFPSNFTFKSSVGDFVVIDNINYQSTSFDFSITSKSNTGLQLNSINYNYVENIWTNSPGSIIFYYTYNLNLSQNLSFLNDFNNSNSQDLYKTDVAWYDIFGHLYNFLIYLVFDMPLISNITKPVYMLVSGTTTTFNWLAGLIAGLGIFGAFAMVYLLFAIIKRFL